MKRAITQVDGHRDVQSAAKTPRAAAAATPEETKGSTFVDKGPRLHGAPQFFKERAELPIAKFQSEIIKAVRLHNAVVLVGETGSGKTTQVPQYLFHAHLGGQLMIAITQPRRVAAITVSQRVAEEMGTTIGDQVGYSIRFDDTVSDRTYIKFATDGMLLREAQLDSNLSAYSIIILDEAHERTLSTDVLFGVVKKAMQARSDLKVVIMSATLDIGLFSRYFGAHVVKVPGRQFPVDVLYTSEPQPDYLDATLLSCLQLHLEEPQGDVLVFLPGQEDIEALSKLLLRKISLLPPTAMSFIVCPLFAALPAAEQLAAFAPPPHGHRKFVLCTNIAETSVTVHGVRYVIDCGLAKNRSFQPATGMEILAVSEISKAQAWQRAGRAGREAPGKCFRLYPEEAFEKLATNTVAEVHRVSLASVVLRLVAMNIHVPTFDFLEAPSKAALKDAYAHLINLTALDPKTGAVTPTGQAMSALPLLPHYSLVLLKAAERGCLDEAIQVVALLSVEGVFYTPQDKREEAMHSRRKFVSPDGDHVTLLNAYRAYLAAKADPAWCHEHFVNGRALKQAQSIAEQLKAVCKTLELQPSTCLPDTEPMLKAFTAGCFLNVARRQPAVPGRSRAQYRTVQGSQEVHIHPMSVLFGRTPPPELIVYNEVVSTTKQYMRCVSKIEPAWLPEVAPQCFSSASSAIGTGDKGATAAAGVMSRPASAQPYVPALRIAPKSPAAGAPAAASAKPASAAKSHSTGAKPAANGTATPSAAAGAPTQATPANAKVPFKINSTPNPSQRLVFS